MIPKGYQLQVTTWENDADNYYTSILSGLTKEDVMFYAELASNFRSVSDRDNPGLGNEYVPAQSLINIVEKLIQKYPNISKKHMDDWVECLEDAKKQSDDEDDDGFEAGWIYELLTDTILGIPSEFYCNEPNFCRVVDKITVFYIPEDAEDVTEQFKFNWGLV